MNKIGNIIRHLLQENGSDAKPPKKQKLVIIMAYLRGGSSFLGRLLSMNPDVMYWYEPLADIYNSFTLSRTMTLTLHVLFNQDGTPR